jgi:hypothetical protein
MLKLISTTAPDKTFCPINGLSNRKMIARLDANEEYGKAHSNQIELLNPKT